MVSSPTATFHSNAHRDARSHRQRPAQKAKRTASGAQRTFVPVAHPFGPKRPNKIAAAQHVESAGTVARLTKDALGDVIQQLLGKKGTDPAMVSALQTAQNSMGLIETTIDNSGGAITSRGKDVSGVGGGWVAERANSRTMADVNRLAAESGKVTKRTSLGDLKNIMNNPARLGLVERDTAPPPRAASTQAKKPTKKQSKQAKVTGRKVPVGRHTQSGLARGSKAGGKRDVCSKRLAAKPWPAPANGVQYANVEVARLLTELPNLYGMKATYMQAAKNLGFLRDKAFAVYYNDALRYARDPLQVKETCGRPPLATTAVLDAAMDAAKEGGGKTSSYDAAMAVLLQCKRDHMKRKGQAGKPTVSKNTVGNLYPYPHAHMHACT